MLVNQSQNAPIQQISSIETNHSQMIHDVQYDYYGKRLATCSSDGFIKIFDVIDPQNNKQIANIKAHNGPVWQIAWAHPQFGNVLASCGFDKKVSVWREQKNNEWIEIISHQEHKGSVNSVSWGPHELGLILLASGQDGYFSILQRSYDDKWAPVLKIKAHDMGINSISWAPYSEEGEQSEKSSKFATGSCDGSIKLFQFNNTNKICEEIIEFNDGHNKEWVRDVAWNPTNGPYDLLASCSEDGTVVIWNLDKNEGFKENKQYRKTLKFEGPVWRVSWSPQGNMLAVSYAISNNDHAVKVYQEDSQGNFVEVQTLDE